MKRNMDNNDYLFRFMLQFIYAGSSTLILSITYIYTDSWFLYAIALLPFLYGIIRSDFKGSVILGLLLTLSMAFVTFSREVIGAPLTYCFNILFLLASFIAFSIIINRLKRYFALSFLLFVLLCFPLEYFHRSYFGFENVFEILKRDAGFIFRATSLFGFIFVTLIIIAANSMLLLLIGILCRQDASGSFSLTEKDIYICNPADDIALIKHRECLPCLRAPPVGA